MHFVQGRVLLNFLRQSLKKTHLNPIDFLYKILVLTELYFTSDPTAATRASIFAPKGLFFYLWFLYVVHLSIQHSYTLNLLLKISEGFWALGLKRK